MTAPDRGADTAPLQITTLTTGFEHLLEVGAPVFVNFAPGQRRPARTKLRDWANERFLRLDSLGDFSADILFEPGAPWVLKFVVSGYVCVAETTFLSGEANTTEGIYVTFPKAIHVHGLRKYERTETSAAVWYLPDVVTPPDLKQMRPTQLVDLSLGGCALSTDVVVEPNTRLAVAIPSAPEYQPVVFFGTVRHCTPAVAGYTVGVEFDPPDSEHVHVLVTLLGTTTGEADSLSEPE